MLCSLIVSGLSPLRVVFSDRHGEQECRIASQDSECQRRVQDKLETASIFFLIAKIGDGGGRAGNETNNLIAKPYSVDLELSDVAHGYMSQALGPVLRDLLFHGTTEGQSIISPPPIPHTRTSDCPCLMS